MNSKAMKKFAVDARRELLQKIDTKAKQIGIADNAIIEEAAYTWFIRLIALRFMEVNKYISEKIFDAFYETEEAFQQTIITTCNYLHKFFPPIFSTNRRYIEALLPEGLLTESWFISKLTGPKTIPEENWKQVETLGWLYQYFFTEEKDRVVKAKKKYKKEEIPYATQLFTPDWIVRYMVQNTLGRYWVESHPEHKDLLKNWEFYLENPNQGHEINEKLEPFINKKLQPEDIKCFDPAMGSGHILVYMFDVLVEIYRRCGYNEREIPRLIVENNLFGIDIDDRVYQLARFSIAMKAMQYDPDFLATSSDEGFLPNFATIQETNKVTAADIAYFAGESEGSAFTKIKYFMDKFADAKTYGSLVDIDSIDYDFIKEKYHELINRPAHTIAEEQSRKKLLELVPLLLKQAEILQRQYDVLITNPPYIGNRYLNSKLAKHVDAHFPIGKKDLFSAFMLYGFKKVTENGQLGFMTPYVWMFISSYEELRTYIINEKNVSSLILLEYSGFDGATVPICTFTLRNYNAGLPGEYINLADFKGVKNQPIKALEAVKKPNVDYRFSVQADIFNKIPGHPLSFWAGEKTIQAIANADKLERLAKPRVGLQTSDNQRFLRLWYEVDFRKIGFGMNNREEALESKLKWFPYNKGGEFRKWYGNQFYVVNWENDGKEIREFNAYLNASRASKIGIANTEFYFKESITWSFVSSSHFGVRYSDKGFIFDTGGSSVFVNEDVIYYVAAFLCSKLAFEFLRIQNPTLNFQPGNIANLPLVISKNNHLIEKITKLAKENITFSKREWDSYELSWNFSVHPLLKFKDSSSTLKNAFANWHAFTQQQFMKMKKNEEKLNRMFIDIYGLGDEIKPDVKDEHVTIRRANKEREIKSFISYAIGCIFGRYSLDEEGLIFAGGEYDPNRYEAFQPTKDNIMPIVFEECFENDVVTRFVEFVKVTFGEETLAENLEYIADTLGRKSGETVKDALRRYFLHNFYKDHLQTYKKRPIYWVFTSGKHKAFNCLLYIHRYDKETLARIRSDYLPSLKDRLESEKRTEEAIIKHPFSPKEIRAAKNHVKRLDLKLIELEKFDKLLQQLANERIEINLDDGVAVNYKKFSALVAPIK